MELLRIGHTDVKFIPNYVHFLIEFGIELEYDLEGFWWWHPNWMVKLGDIQILTLASSLVRLTANVQKIDI